MNQLRRAVLAAYVVAGILLVFTALDLAQATWPPNPGDLGWRVITVGLLSRVLVTPILALLLIHVAALFSEHRRVLMTMAVADAVLAIVLLLGLGAFALDALQMRTQVGPDARSNYDFGLMASFLKLGVTGLFLLFIGFSQWRTAGRLNREVGRRKASSTPLVMSKATRTPAATRVNAGE